MQQTNTNVNIYSHFFPTTSLYVGKEVRLPREWTYIQTNKKLPFTTLDISEKFQVCWCAHPSTLVFPVASFKGLLPRLDSSWVLHRPDNRSKLSGLRLANVEIGFIN